jgi:hypothetical protein
MNALESRKQLLIAESELNRSRLRHELQTMAAEVHALAHHARTAGSIAAVVATLLGGFSAFRHKKPAPAPENSSWWQTIGKVAGMASTVWLAFRARPKS